MKGWRIATAALLILAAWGCATDVGTIDRTQNDKLQKKLFAGIWYYNQVVIDVPDSTAATFVGEATMGSINKIVWDIQEKYLVAYPTSEWIVGSEKDWHKHRIFKYWDQACMDSKDGVGECIDGKDNLNDPSKLCCYVELYVGQPLAAFPIKSHFDVKRQYNAQTGAQTNVLEENTVDKKWWKRAYMRVDWSQNKINDYSFMARINKATPVDYYVQEWEGDHKNPDAPTITDNYIDVVTKTYVDPAPNGCDVYGMSYYDCVPAVLKIRNSFRKVKPNDDYIPARYHNDEEQKMFGFFLTQRQGFDPDWGLNYSGALYLINRWNLWRDNFDTTDIFVPLEQDGKTLQCTDDAHAPDECNNPDARCVNGQCKIPKPCFKTPMNNGCDPMKNEYCYADHWFTRGHCKIRTPKPYLERKLHPIVYWMSADTPDFMQDVDYHVVSSWNKVFKETVAWLYLWESKGWIYGDQRVRSCETDQDCASHALADQYINVGSKVGNHPAAKTAVFTDSHGLLQVLDATYPDAGVKAVVRLINVSDKAVDLAVKGGSVISAGVQPFTKNGNPPFAQIDKGNGVVFSVGSGANVLATSMPVDAVSGSVIYLVYDGKNLYAVRAFANDINGIRLINASSRTIDVGYHGALVASALPPGGSTDYLKVPQYVHGNQVGSAPQRVTVIEHGQRGDITCYREEQQGTCVGWFPNTTDADLAQVKKIEKSLPNLFVMCQNQYDGGDFVGSTETGDQNPWQSVQGSKDMQWISRAYDGTVNADGTRNADGSWYNPCVDAIPWTENDTPEQKLQIARSMKKEGDSRFPMVYYIPEDQMASPLGYSPSAADPDTGEIYWAVANIYGAPMRTWATYNRDILDLVNGNLKVDDYITGKYVRDYLLGVLQGKKSGALTAGGKAAVERNTFMDKLIAEDHQPWVTNRTPKDAQGLDATMLDVMKTLHNTDYLKRAVSGLPAMGTNTAKQRLAALKGTPIEDLLMTPEMKVIMSHGTIGPNDPVTPDEKAKISPLDWMNSADILKKDRERRLFLAKHNFMSRAALNYENQIYAAKKWGCYPGTPHPDTCLTGEKLMQKILDLSLYSVTVHEVGHTLGLRHNFAGSTDLFNYFDQYYDIRERQKVPCHNKGECEEVLGQDCVNGYCAVKTVTQCSADADCGNGQFKCVQGQCFKYKSCGRELECDAGQICDTSTDTCMDAKTGKYALEKVVAQGETDPKDPTIHYVKEMIPRPAMTEKEAEEGRSMYQYSSIMDYGQRWSSDIYGPGKYDKAAIRFGYGRIVDVYRDIKPIIKVIKAYANYYSTDPSGVSYYMDSSFWNSGIYMSQFYFMDYMIGPKANLDRASVPWEWVKLQHNQADNYFDQQWYWHYVQVPYKFASDDYEGNVDIYMWDTGVDSLEIAYNMMVRLKDYYIVDAFMRERYGFGLHGDPYYYFSRVYSRYMDRVRMVGMFYALYAHILKEYSWRGMWANSRLMGWALRRASELSFTMLANELAGPAPGSYKLDAKDNLYKNFSYKMNQPGSQLNIPLGIGKYPYTKFMSDAGYYYYDHALWIGSFWDKMAALMTLIDSTVYFTTNYVGEQLDVGVGTSIGFNTMYTSSLLKLFGGIIADDYNLFADMVDKKGNIEPRIFFDPDNTDAYSVSPPPYATPHVYGTSDPAVQPSISDLALKLYVAAYAMAYLPASFEPAYLDAFAVCLKGTGECRNMDTSIQNGEQVEFKDPFSGKTYLAWANNYGDNPYSPMADLLKKANSAVDAWNAATGADKDKAKLQVQKYVTLIEQLRQLFQYMNYMRI